MPEMTDKASVRASAGGSSRTFVAYGGNRTDGPVDVAAARNAHRGGRYDFETETFIVPETTHTLRASGFDASEDGTGRGTPIVPIAFSSKDHGADAGTVSPTVRSCGFKDSHANAGGPPAVTLPQGVRRLMPVETERLQGFPDNWTAFGASGTHFSDGPRYAMCGNAVAAPCAFWLGQRIARSIRT